jgi:hypothetical protein
MLKPDFGRVSRIDWTPDRIAYVRHLAEERNMSAREIALDIGLAANQHPRIFELCKRCGIALSGQAGRPRRDTGAARAYSVGVSGRNAALLALLAQRHSTSAGRLVEMLLNAAFETGETFCENLLEMDSGE